MYRPPNDTPPGYQQKWDANGIPKSSLHALAAKPCTHCPCFGKFVSEQKKTMDQFLVNQQKVMAEILNVQHSILQKLSARDGANVPAVTPTQLECQNPNEIPLFSFTAIKALEELEDLEQKLHDSEYFDEVLNWLNSIIEEDNPRNRMMQTLDLIFDKRFLIQCSWTGLGKFGAKIPMMNYKNVCKVFKEIGCTYSSTISPKDVTRFFRTMLKYAKQRAKNQGLRKSTCRVRRKYLEHAK
uniref:DUF4806 domain-containing protein n=1 Tax=Anopheles farauti TaxID=69004 RepID=A0A182PZW7_9DIPT